MTKQAQTYLSVKPKQIISFAIALGVAARLFTLHQLARHPDLSGLSKPAKKASEIISAHPDIFEKLNGPHNQPSRWRLTKLQKRRMGIQQKAINGISQRAEHWLGLGDIWMSLTFYGGRPTEWRLEPDKQFDVMCMWRGSSYLIEYQRTPITTKQWEAKWEKRRAWYKAQKWVIEPRVVLVTTMHQETSTMCVPTGTIHAKSIDEVPRLLSRH